MKRHRALLTTIAAFFIIVNTTYYWEGWFGSWGFVVGMLLVLVFFVLLAILLMYIYRAVIQRFKIPATLYMVSILAVVLGTAVFLPGLFDPEQFLAKDVLIAVRKASGGCTSTLKLKADHTFYIRFVCFGVEKATGTYTVHRDTVTFKFDRTADAANYIRFGIIKPDVHPNNKYVGEIELYKSETDKAGIKFMVITKNELTE